MNDEKNKSKNFEQEKYKELCSQLIEQNEIRIITEDELKFFDGNSSKIGEGGQASVYIGILDQKYKVAVKVLKNIDWKNLSNELIIISYTQHENIPKFYGVTLGKDEKIRMVFEFIEGDTLDKFGLIGFSSLTDTDKLNIAKGIASALIVIYDNKFIHRDVKPENIIIDKNKKPYLIDFGIGKVLLQDEEALTRAKGSLFYTAPEIFIAVGEDKNSDMFISVVTHKADVWSFGCILSYLFSGLLPWHKNQNIVSDSSVYKSLLEKKPFPIPSKISDSRIKEIIKMATEIVPENRANIKQIYDELIKIVF